MKMDLVIKIRALTVKVVLADVTDISISKAQTISPQGLEAFIDSECHDLIGSWLFSDVCRLYKRIELFVADRLGNSSVFESADNFLSVEIFNGDSHLYLANK